MASFMEVQLTLDRAIIDRVGTVAPKVVGDRLQTILLGTMLSEIDARDPAVRQRPRVLTKPNSLTLFPLPPLLHVPQNAPLLGAITAAINTSSPAYAAAAAAVGSFEARAPQDVSLIAFPTAAYSSNAFYTTAIDFFSFFFVLTFLLPVSRLVRGIVYEKESRIREGMKMMVNVCSSSGQTLHTYTHSL